MKLTQALTCSSIAEVSFECYKETGKGRRVTEVEVRSPGYCVYHQHCHKHLCVTKLVQRRIEVGTRLHCYANHQHGSHHSNVQNNWADKAMRV